MRFPVGQRDNTVTRDAMMAHLSAIVAATDLPVSADLANCFGEGAGNGRGDDPSSRGSRSRRRFRGGGRGQGEQDGPIYCLEHAVARVEAAAE